MNKKPSTSYLTILANFEDEVSELCWFINNVYEKIKNGKINNETLLQLNHYNYTTYNNGCELIKKLCEKYWINNI